MPQEHDDDDTTDEQDNPNLRQLRQKAKQADELAARLERFERENAVYKAGLNGLTERQVNALIASHDGDWTPEALRTTATDLGWHKAEEEQGADPEEQAAHERIADASKGSVSPAARDWDAEIAQAASPEQVIAIVRERGGRIAGDND